MAAQAGFLAHNQRKRKNKILLKVIISFIAFLDIIFAFFMFLIFFSFFLEHLSVYLETKLTRKILIFDVFR